MVQLWRDGNPNDGKLPVSLSKGMPISSVSLKRKHIHLTEGELNGQTYFGGKATKDPRHGDTAEETLSVECSDTTKTGLQLAQEIRNYSAAYSGEWR